MLDYGIIGNCKTCALIKKDGSVDWMCFPTFSSPSVFAKILDEQKGGSLEIQPIGEYTITQRYLPKTAILETVFESNEAGFKLIDFFPRHRSLLFGTDSSLVQVLKNNSVTNILKNNSLTDFLESVFESAKENFSVVEIFPRYLASLLRNYTPATPHNYLVRILKPLHGIPKFKIIYNPKPNYAAEKVRWKEEEKELIYSTATAEIRLTSNLSCPDIKNGREIELRNDAYLAVGDYDVSDFSIQHCLRELKFTTKY